jgi:uncharacterized protein YhbP (UPF0306 family)
MACFLSTEVNTRHGKILLKSPRVAGTINNQCKILSEIKGVQYQGEMKIVDNNDKASYQLYCERFQELTHALPINLWKLQLDEIKMTNNKLGFGKKIVWKRRN